MTALRAEPSPRSEQAATAVVDLRHVSVDYGSGTALHDVSLEIRAGERVALIGPSGAGKSTLLALCRGEVRPTTGEVRILGVPLASLEGRALRRTRRSIGTVHQHLHLVDQLKVIHNVNAGLLASWTRRRALWSLLRPQGVAQARMALAQVGIADKLFERTDRLSGGEQQRVALARVLLQDPALILADEPISSLDPARGREVMDLLRSVADDGERTLIVSVHAFQLARSHCDRIVGLRDGIVAFDLPADEVTDDRAASLYEIVATG